MVSDCITWLLNTGRRSIQNSILRNVNVHWQPHINTERRSYCMEFTREYTKITCVNLQKIKHRYTEKVGQFFCQKMSFISYFFLCFIFYKFTGIFNSVLTARGEKSAWSSEDQAGLSIYDSYPRNYEDIGEWQTSRQPSLGLKQK